jgi:hypothetical protein
MTRPGIIVAAIGALLAGADTADSQRRRRSTSSRPRRARPNAT